MGRCSAVDDWFVKNVPEQCGDVDELKVWGCQRVTEHCARKVCADVEAGVKHCVDGCELGTALHRRGVTIDAIQLLVVRHVVTYAFGTCCAFHV